MGFPYSFSCKTGHFLLPLSHIQNLEKNKINTKGSDLFLLFSKAEDATKVRKGVIVVTFASKGVLFMVWV